jgi:hypothetical protein
MDFITGLPRV